MGTLIDSSVVIAAERGLLDLDRILSEHSDEEPLVLSSVTAAELLHGVHRAKSAAQRHRREAWVERVLSTLSVVPFDLLAARAHARVWAELAAKGTNLAERDLTIGAIALALGFTVATRDRRSFSKIPGLSVERW
ncbi:MAG: PIN domain-containing protein [Candidatus Binataceae bacterium]